MRYVRFTRPLPERVAREMAKSEARRIGSAVYVVRRGDGLREAQGFTLWRGVTKREHATYPLRCHSSGTVMDEWLQEVIVGDIVAREAPARRAG